MDALDSVTKIEERIVIKATQANIPLGGTFELTPLCNMNCDMCFIRLSKDEMNQRGKLKSGKEWLEIARQMKEAGTLFVLLTGGEPLLHPDFIEIYQGLRKLGMIITINTNGTLITKEIAEVLGKDKPRRVNITLYGASNETYEKLCHNPKGYDQTMKGIQLLMEHHIDIKLNGSIVPLNYHEINDLQNIANHLHLYIKMDTYMFPGHRERFKAFNQENRLNAQLAAKCDVKIKKLQLGENHFKEYAQTYLNQCHVDGKKDYCGLSCRAGKSAFWITWNGLMTSCVFLKHISKDVFTEGFKTCWDYLVNEYKNICMPESCLSCHHREVCQVCGASVYTETDGLEEKPTYLCEYTKEVIDLLRNEVKNEKD